MRRDALMLCLVAIAFSILIPASVDAQTPAIKGTPAIAVSSTTLEEHLDVVYAKYGDRAMHLDLIRPKNASGDLPAVLLVHGGGWTQGNKTRFHAMAQALAWRGYVTASVEYRLAGEAKFPAAIHDVNAAIRWLRANSKQYGIDPQRIAAVGGSAGGHLVALAAAAPEVKELQGDGGNPEVSSRLQAAVVMAGPLDLTSGPVAERSRKEPDSNVNQWLGKTIDQAPELYKLASPVTHLSEKTPPILFQHGELDRPEQNLAARERLRELKVACPIEVYHQGKHGCWNEHPWFEPMVGDMDAFLRRVLKHQIAPEWRHRHAVDWGEIAFVPEGLDLHVQKPVTGVAKIPRMNRPVGPIYLKGDEKKGALTLNPGLADWSIVLPKSLIEAGQGIVRVEGPGLDLLELPRVISPDETGSVTLAAHDGVTHGQLLRYEPQPHKNTIGYWAKKEDWCEWHFYVDRPGKFEVRILQGCGKGQGGSEVLASIGDESVAFTVEDTGHFQNFKERSIGTIAIPRAGTYTFKLEAKTKPAGAVMDVRQVHLKPVAP